MGVRGLGGYDQISALRTRLTDLKIDLNRISLKNPLSSHTNHLRTKPRPNRIRTKYNRRVETVLFHGY